MMGKESRLLYMIYSYENTFEYDRYHMIRSLPTDNPLDKVYYPQLSSLSGQFLHTGYKFPCQHDVSWYTLVWHTCRWSQREP